MRIRVTRALALILAFQLAVLSSASAQNWSAFLDPSRAIDWTATGAGFTIPNYTVLCSTQPSLTAGAGNATANSNSINAALGSCDATHNVVLLPAGTYYVNGINYSDSGRQVLRGAGPNCNGCTLGGTDLIFTSAASEGCGGIPAGMCMSSSGYATWGAVTTPPSGTRQCAWTAGYAQGSTSVTLNTCPGSLPSVGQWIILDQANDLTDNGGVFLCDSFTSSQAGGNPHCSGNDGSPANGSGRQFVVGGNAVPPTYSQKQLTVIQSISGSGSGPYTVGIHPPIYFTNVRTGQAPGAWWVGQQVVNDGIENLTLDATSLNNGSIASAIEMAGCNQCWERNVRSIDSTRAHVLVIYSANDVIRDDYFYQSQTHAEQSYGVEIEQSSAALIENNIFQQLSNPIMHGSGTGDVVSYNLSLDNLYSSSYLQFSDYDHNAGSEMNLWEGNMFQTIWGDEEFGSSFQGMIFRNHMPGWQTGKLWSTVPFALRAYLRGFNVVGNVMGQAGYHTNYESYANSTATGINQSLNSVSIYGLGYTGVGETTSGTCSIPPVCDPLTRSTLMRWGNYDVVTAGVKWDSTEASPGAVQYINANFTSTYFNSLAHTLPASLYYSSTPPWWPAGKTWPPIGPDVGAGNVGTCTGGSYDGSLATNAGQCTGGTLSSAWASHVTSIPALDCYLSTMAGPPDGSGSVLSFDANACYSSTPQGSSVASWQTIPIATALRTAAQGQVLVCKP